MKKPCNCIYATSDLVCKQEKYQLDILVQIIQVSDLGNLDDALIYAGYIGHLRIAEYFIGLGANANIQVKTSNNWFKRSITMNYGNRSFRPIRGRTVSLLEKCI